MSENGQLTTECECHDPAHIMVFHLVPASSRDSALGLPPDLYLSCQLNPRWGFWGRCWNALRYILGRQSRYGHWSEGSLSLESAQALLPLLLRFIALAQEAESGTRTGNVAGKTNFISVSGGLMEG